MEVKELKNVINDVLFQIDNHLISEDKSENIKNISNNILRNLEYLEDVKKDLLNYGRSLFNMLEDLGGIYFGTDTGVDIMNLIIRLQKQFMEVE